MTHPQSRRNAPSNTPGGKNFAELRSSTLGTLVDLHKVRMKQFNSSERNALQREWCSFAVKSKMASGLLPLIPWLWEGGRGTLKTSNDNKSKLGAGSPES